MFVKHFEIINCTVIAFSRCDSITPQKTVLSERSLCVRDHSETGCRMRHQQKFGDLHAVERLAGKFGLVPPSKLFTYLREMKGEDNSILCPIWVGAGS